MKTDACSVLAHAIVSALVGAGCKTTLTVKDEPEPDPPPRRVLITSADGIVQCEGTVPAGVTLRHVCLPPGEGGKCPTGDAEVREAFSKQPCEVMQPSSMACGPVPFGAEPCCYYGHGEVDRCVPVPGRPFVVAGEVRRARVRTADDAALAPDVTRLDAGERAELAAAWLADGLEEHASIATFARFALELMAVGAPLELVDACRQAMGDEITHARMSFALASAYGGQGVGAGALDVQGALGAVDCEELGLRTFREGCVGETCAALAAAEAAAGCVDPVVREVQLRIAADETAHALLAWRFVRWALAARPSLGAAMAQELERLGSVAAPREEGRAWRREHGCLDAVERQALAARAVHEVVIPCARALFA